MMRQLSYSQTHQQGVALLTILLMVVVASILATSMLLKQQRTLRETSMLTRQDQALQYALAGEVFIESLLKSDSETNDTDSVKDIWANPLPPYPVEDGFVLASVTERSGRFNLNNLFHSGKADAAQLAYFKRLLKQLGLSEEIAEAVVDWQDPDSEATGNGGAEADFYASTGVVPANQPFIHVSELADVRGVDAAAYQALKPHVFVAPNYSKLNVNTATAELLAALGENLATNDVTNWTASRGQNNATESVDDFFAVVPFSNIDSKEREKLKLMLATTSDYFQARIQVNLSGRNRYVTSDIMRQDKNASVYQRSLSPFVMTPASKAKQKS